MNLEDSLDLNKEDCRHNFRFYYFRGIDSQSEMFELYMETKYRKRVHHCQYVRGLWTKISLVGVVIAKGDGQCAQLLVNSYLCVPYNNIPQAYVISSLQYGDRDLRRKRQLGQVAPRYEI
jgi:hypothetical protein